MFEKGMKQLCKTLVSLIAVIIRAAFAGHSILDATFAAFRAVKYLHGATEVIFRGTLFDFS